MHGNVLNSHCLGGGYMDGDYWSAPHRPSAFCQSRWIAQIFYKDSPPGITQTRITVALCGMLRVVAPAFAAICPVLKVENQSLHGRMKHITVLFFTQLVESLVMCKPLQTSTQATGGDWGVPSGH